MGQVGGIIEIIASKHLFDRDIYIVKYLQYKKLDSTLR